MVQVFGVRAGEAGVFYQWLKSYEKLSHGGHVAHEHFCSSLSGKNTLFSEEYEEFCAEFHKRGCVTMIGWLREYNLADFVPFVEAVHKTGRPYYEDGIDILKDAVSIPGVAMRYVLNKLLKLKPAIELYTPGEPCKHKSKACCFRKTCKTYREIQNLCKDCVKNQAYELLQTGMVGGTAIVFCRYHERDITGIRSHVHENANMLYPSTLLQDFPFWKEKLFILHRNRDATSRY